MKLKTKNKGGIMKHFFEAVYVLCKVSRPIGWIVLPLVFIMGFYERVEHPLFTHLLSHPEYGFLPFVQLLLFSFPASLIGYGINDMYDRGTDLLNDRKTYKYLDGVPLSLAHFRLIKVGVYVSATFMVLSGFSTGNMANSCVMAGVVACAFLYSAPPVRLKGRAPFDSIINCVLYGYGPFTVGYTYSGESVFSMSFRYYLFFLTLGAIHAFFTVIDVSADKAAGINTFAVKYGQKNTIRCAIVIVALTLLFGRFEMVGTNVFLCITLLCMICSLFIPLGLLEIKAKKCCYGIFCGFLLSVILLLGERLVIV